MRKCAGLLLLLSSSAFGQNVSRSLSCTVQDTTGAPIPGAAITLTSLQNGFVWTTKSNDDGFFSFPDLSASTFTLAVTAPGFKRYTQSGIAITSGESRSLGSIRLALGELSESVTIEAETTPVMLGSGERTAVLTGNEISGMALRGRDFMDAVGLMPGVVDAGDGRESPSPTSINNIYILGARGNQKNMTIDGVTSLDTGSNGSVHSMPSMDSLGEVKVLMSNYAAEYGRNSGGTMNVITRGGTRDFHAEAGWYHRHEQMTANNFFNNRNGVPRPPYRYNIFSYTLGGPVTIPGHFNSDRSKLFFFFSQEFQRQLVSYGAARTVTVPTALERQGDFSQTFDVNGKLRPVDDPLNNQKQLPGNRIPASRLTPAGRSILNLFPVPNFVDPNPSRLYQWNYISDMSGSYPRRTDTARIDYSPHANWRMYARLSNNSDEQHAPYGLWVNGSVNFPLTPIVFHQPGRGAALNITTTLSPAVFNQFIVGVSQNKLTFYPEFPDRVSRKATGIDILQSAPSLNPQRLIPNMSFSSVSNYANPSLNNGIPYYNSNTIFSFVENLGKVAGAHTFKVGFYIERTRKDQSASVATRGSVSFNADRNNPLDANYAYANALLGVFDSYSEANARPQGQFRFSNFEWYAQDAWRVRSGLMLNYGIRFYHDLPQYDARLQLASFVPGLYDPALAPVLLRPTLDASGTKVAVDPISGRTFPGGFVGTYARGVGVPSIGMVHGGKDGLPPGLYATPSVGLGPRASFAWDPFGRGRTAVRGGAGVYFDRIQGNPTMGLLSNPPTVYEPTVYYGTLDNLAATAGTGVLAPSSSVTSMLGQHGLPTVYNYSFGVQHQVSRATLLDVSYVGSISRHFLWERNINPVPIGARFLDKNPQNKDVTATGSHPLPDNFLRPYQGYGDIFLYEFASTGNYNSLQVTVNRRMARGVTIGAAYTFGKALGSADSDTAKVSPFFDPRQRNYGPLSYDRAHVFNLRYNWTLPKPGRLMQSRLLGKVADGWELAGITRFSTGAPFTPGFSTVDGQDITGTPSEGARINVADPNADPLHRFGRPARGSFGNAGVGALRGPGMNNWDISLYRSIPIRERLRAQLRFESYNTFNHTQFSSLVTTARFDAQGNQVDPLFLDPSAAFSARRLQLAVRVMW